MAPKTKTTRAERARIAAEWPQPRKATNGSGSVVARALADGKSVYDVYWSYYSDDGRRLRAVKRGFRTMSDAEKHRRAMTATVDTGRLVAPRT